MFVEHFVWITPLAGGSGPEWGFWPTLFGGIMAALAAREGIIIGVKNMKDFWEIVTTDTLAIDEATAAGELVQIRGRVRPTQPDNTFTSPILNEECVAYEYNIEKYGVNIKKVLPSNDSEPVESGSKYSSFIISDGSGEVFVDPGKDNLSLNTTTETLSTKKEQTADKRIEVEPTSYKLALGDSTKPVDLTEGTVSVGEEITVIGKTAPVPEETITDADAVMTPEEGNLRLMDGDPQNIAKTKARQGTFALILASGFSFFAIFIFRDAILTIV
ncbi:GIDE domain-containing protein (plasmid) [Haloplanus ruber]|uniref:GIDE domain-containing protein n=1 Tax=Haloplanus ruber TaxID=869892 RepID=A0ABD6CVP1_9EURY|nr:GIDE domain-containing protein [Haloplanus ruber]